MKIGILLLSIDPSYRGGVNSFVHGLLGGLNKLTVPSGTKFYLIIRSGHESYYEKYKCGHIDLYVVPAEGMIARKIKNLIRMLFIVPKLRALYFAVESWLYRDVVRRIDDLNCEVYYCPTIPYFPLGIKGKTVISPHDVQHVHYPENFNWIEHWQRDTVFSIGMKSATVVQASSDLMRSDFEKHFGVKSERIAVIPEGVMDDFLNFQPSEQLSCEFLEKYRLSGGYIFYPSQHWPHKNHITLIKAVAIARERSASDLCLVFTGVRNDKFLALYDFIDKGGYGNFIKFLGNIKFSDLLYAYVNAMAVVIPVVYESSSLPAKEAMALGKAVIASANGVNEEININNNILLFNTFDSNDLADKILLLQKDENFKTDMIKRAKAVAADFSWTKIAVRYLELFNTLGR